MSNSRPKTDASKPIADELVDEQLDKVSGGMAISPAVTSRNALTPSTGMTAGSIAEGDTIGGDGMPDQKTG